MAFKTMILLVAGVGSLVFSGLLLEVLMPLYVNTLGGNALLFLVFGFVMQGVCLICLAIKDALER